jgi:hypothetical protein
MVLFASNFPEFANLQCTEWGFCQMHNMILNVDNYRINKVNVVTKADIVYSRLRWKIPLANEKKPKSANVTRNEPVRILISRLSNYYVGYIYRCRPGSSVGIVTGYGMDCPGVESRWGRDFPHLSRPAHPASCTMGTGSFPGVEYGRDVTLTPHPF